MRGPPRGAEGGRGGEGRPNRTEPNRTKGDFMGKLRAGGCAAAGVCPAAGRTRVRVTLVAPAGELEGAAFPRCFAPRNGSQSAGVPLHRGTTGAFRSSLGFNSGDAKRGQRVASPPSSPYPKTLFYSPLVVLRRRDVCAESPAPTEPKKPAALGFYLPWMPMSVRHSWWKMSHSGSKEPCDSAFVLQQ